MVIFIAKLSIYPF